MSRKSKVKQTRREAPVPAGTAPEIVPLVPPAAPATEAENTPPLIISDRRHWARPPAAEAAEEAALPDSKPAYVQELEEKTALLEQRFQERTAQFEEETRAVHERLARQMERRLEEETHKIILDLLEVLDNLDAAIAAASQDPTPSALLDGVRLVRAMFARKMGQIGLRIIDPSGEPFDPRFHEAIEIRLVESPDQANLIVQVWQKGYAIGDRLLRPARVAVGQYRPPGP